MTDFSVHSPVEELSHPLFIEKNVRLFIKRDDMIHPFISGNKWRKLKYLIADAIKQEKKHLITFGGAFSNHLLATAAAGAGFNLKTTGIVRGEETNPLNDTLFLCKQFGMELIFADRESYRDKEKLYSSYFGKANDCYSIDEGGAGPLAMQGCAELVKELDKPYDYIFAACGTGTTLAGIVNGIENHRIKTQTIGIPVLKGAQFLEADIFRLTNKKSGFELLYDYHFGGYAKTTDELLEFMRDFHRRYGILLDPVYTGKMLFAIFDKIKNDYFPQNRKILALHTGGLFGLLGMKNRF